MAPTPSLSIALLGSRGIPARYGGYETFMEEIAGRLVSMGHEVTVYCRSHYTRPDEKEHLGARLVVLPTLRTKYLDTPVHTLLSSLHAVFSRYDAVLIVNSANALFVPIIRWTGTPTALHVDGIEKRRAKWGAVGRWVYAVSERLACILPNVLVTDAEVIQQHYRLRYNSDSWMITYGVDARPPSQRSVLAKLGLNPGEYFLYVSRFEPENNPDKLIIAYEQVKGDIPLVMVGDAPYADDFIRSFRDRADARVLFPGAIYGDGYRELQSEALAYIQATEVGGTHPALVEAMGYGNCLLVNDAPENREVAGEPALYFKAEEPATLARQMQWVLDHPDETKQRGCRSAERAKDLYSWDSVTRKYDDLFRHLTGHA